MNKMTEDGSGEDNCIVSIEKYCKEVMKVESEKIDIINGEIDVLIEKRNKSGIKKDFAFIILKLMKGDSAIE